MRATHELLLRNQRRALRVALSPDTLASCELMTNPPRYWCATSSLQNYREQRDYETVMTLYLRHRIVLPSTARRAVHACCVSHHSNGGWMVQTFIKAREGGARSRRRSRRVGVALLLPVRRF